MLRSLAQGWFVPIYIGLICLGLHDHIFGQKFWVTAGVGLGLEAFRAMWGWLGSLAHEDAKTRPANDY